MKKYRMGLFVCALCTIFLVACAPTRSVPLTTEPRDVELQPQSDQAPVVTKAPSRKFRVGVSLQDESPFVMRVSDRLQTIVKNQAPDIELVIYNGKGNSLTQIAHVESFISGGFDLVLMDPISYTECMPAVNIAKEAGVPIITFITRVENQTDCTSFVGSNHMESGIIQAQMVAKYLAGNGRIVILEGVMGIEAQKGRYEGYQQVFAKYPGIKIVAMQTAAWQRAEAKAIVQNWIEAGKQFDVVVSENDNMAMGAIEAIESADLSERIAVFGIDGDADALEAVKERRMVGTVYQDADKQAETLFGCIQKIKAYDKVESEYFIPFEAVTNENVDYYLTLYKSK